MADGAQQPKPVLVLGIGNILLRDEGVGVRVVEAMQGLDLPEDVELLDGGTAGANLVDLIADRQKVVCIDAIAGQREPGTVVRFAPDDLMPTGQRTVSLHQVGLLDAVIMARRMGCMPAEMVILGIQPADLSPGLELTPAVAAMVPRVIELVLAELE